MNLTKDLLLSITRAASTIVQKKWGAEFIVVNNDKFCLKYLLFYKGGKISFHAHHVKTELFNCISGKLGIITQNRPENYFEGDVKKGIFRAGDKILLEPYTYHSLEAFEDSIIVEISTTDRVEDSFRLNESSFNPDNDANIKNYE